MTRKLKKRSMNMSRRQFIKTSVAMPAAILVGKSSAQNLDNPQDAVSWRRYNFSLNLYVPRIYSNSKSLGYRKYQRQHITMKMAVGFNASNELACIQFEEGAVNKTHVLSNGQNVTYDVMLDDGGFFPRLNAIGNNKTGSFKTASICISLAAEPSYNIGEFDEDTSLYMTLAGRGTINKNGQIKNAKGNVAGTIGCGCMAYGHKSPTRKIGYNGATETVTDVASIYGTWTMKPL